jgi:hypothetical protein
MEDTMYTELQSHLKRFGYTSINEYLLDIIKSDIEGNRGIPTVDTIKPSGIQNSIPSTAPLGTAAIPVVNSTTRWLPKEEWIAKQERVMKLPIWYPCMPKGTACRVQKGKYWEEEVAPETDATGAIIYD